MGDIYNMDAQSNNKSKSGHNHKNTLLTENIRSHLDTPKKIELLAPRQRAAFLWQQKGKTGDALEYLIFMLEHLPEKQLKQVITFETLKPLFKQLFQVYPNAKFMVVPNLMISDRVEPSISGREERVLMLCFDAIAAMTGRENINARMLAADKLNTLVTLEAIKEPKEIQGLLAIWLKCLDVNQKNLKPREEVTKDAKINRLSLALLLPRQGDYITMRTVNDLLKEFKISEYEIEEYDVVATTHQNKPTDVIWTLEIKRGTIKREISNRAEGLIVDRLQFLNVKKELPSELLELYEWLAAKKLKEAFRD